MNEVNNEADLSGERIAKVSRRSEIRSTHLTKTSIKDSKGLLVLSSKYRKGDLIRLYNDDGSLWYGFSFYYDDSDGKFEYANEDFAPFAFHQDHFLLALKLIAEDEYRYEVVVNETSGLKKFVKKSDKNFDFESWKDHVLKAFAVRFNAQENPLRDEPDGRVEDLDLSEGTTFRPIKVDGAWLEVQLDGEPSKSGWIRWRDRDDLLVELIYFA